MPGTTATTRNLSGLCLLAALVCATGAGAAEQQAANAPGTGHALSSERLRNVMDGIHRSILERGDEGGTGKLDAQGLEELSIAIEELLYHAELLAPESAPQALSTHDVVTFRALAGQLYDEALTVRDIAAAPPETAFDFNQLDMAYERMYQTCAACHALFRPPADGGR